MKTPDTEETTCWTEERRRDILLVGEGVFIAATVEDRSAEVGGEIDKKSTFVLFPNRFLIPEMLVKRFVGLGVAG